MVYVGIGVLVVSLSFICYKSNLFFWHRRGSSNQIQNPPQIHIEESPQSSETKQTGSNGSASSTRTDGQAGRPPNIDDAELQPTVTAISSSAADDRNQSLEQINNFSGEPNNLGLKSKQSLMPPPSRPDRKSKQKPQTTQSPRPQTQFPQVFNNAIPRAPKIAPALRPPPSAVSTLRIPPARSLAPLPSVNAPTTSTLPSASRPSRKVLLEPGHSPLDWANLVNNPLSSTFLRGSDVPLNLIRVPPSLLRHHNGRKGRNAWGVYQGKVYNLTPYLKFHPGGVDELMKGAGREKDAERLFSEVHPWVNWDGLLGECMVGILVGEEEVNGSSESAGLEAVD
ncbi:MAG: hypothetical protein LQ342_007176 [Letrouitia transgressa]|nr:MAG: hypothetical protein LQ342_007176 [Letrouitia transgressa]